MRVLSLSFAFIFLPSTNFPNWLWKWKKMFFPSSSASLCAFSVSACLFFLNGKLEGYKWKQKIRANYFFSDSLNKKKSTKKLFSRIDLHFRRTVSCCWSSAGDCGRGYHFFGRLKSILNAGFYKNWTNILCWLVASSIWVCVSARLLKTGLCFDCVTK